MTDVYIRCIRAVKLNYTKNNNSLFACFHVPQLVEAESSHQLART